MSEALEFNFETTEVPVKVNGKSYILREADAGQVASFRNKATSGAVMENGKVVGMKGVGELNCYLVSLCLVVDDEKRTPVSLETIKKWPSKVVEKLADEAARISELKDEEETEETLSKKIEELNKALTELRARNKSLGNESSNTDGSSD